MPIPSNFRELKRSPQQNSIVEATTAQRFSKELTPLQTEGGSIPSWTEGHTSHSRSSSTNLGRHRQCSCRRPRHLAHQLRTSFGLHNTQFLHSGKDHMELPDSPYLEENDPTRTKRFQRKDPTASTTQDFMAAKKQSNITRSRYIPVQIKQEVWHRSRGRCEYVSFEGIRCESTYQLQYDHIQPLALRGFTKLSDIRHLCRVHNLHEASRLGIGGEIRI